MATVTNTVKLPDGSIPDRVDVVIELVASTTGKAAAWITATDVTLEATVRPTVTNGAWTTSLTPNADITPSGSVYRVTEYVDKTRYIHHIEVGSDGGSLFDLLVDPPATIESSALAAHKNNPTGAHAASAVSVADTGGYYTGSTAEAALAEIGAHPADSSDVHGIVDTSKLLVQNTTVDPGPSKAALRISKTHGANETHNEAALFIEDKATDPDYSGSLLQIINRKSLPSGRSVFRVQRQGGVYVWDYVKIVPFSDQDATGGTAMLVVASDLTEAGVTLQMRNNFGHDLVHMNDDMGVGAVTNGPDDPAVPRRLTITGPGVVAFGRADVATGAVRNEGPNVAMVLGDNSAYTGVKAGEFESALSSGGLVLTSPNGTRYRVTVNDAGELATAALSTSTLASDDFSEANGTTLSGKALDAGGSWTVQSGTWAVQSGRASCSVAGIATVDVGNADVAVEADLIATLTQEGVIFRLIDASNYWRVRMVNNTTKLNLEKIVAGTQYVQRTHFVDASTGTLKVRTSGSLIRVFWDGIETPMQIDDAFNETATAHGIYAVAGGSLDNFTVTT